MPTELVTLAWSVVLLLLHVVLQGGLATLETGLEYNAGARDEGRKPQGVYAGRAARALTNLLETFPAFIGLALALALVGKTGGWGATGAKMWFWARVAYLPLYVLGVPYVRTFAWLVSAAGLVAMLAALLA